MQSAHQEKGLICNMLRAGKSHSRLSIMEEGKKKKTKLSFKSGTKISNAKITRKVFSATHFHHSRGLKSSSHCPSGVTAYLGK